MRILFTFMCVLALGVMGCGETTGTGGSGGDGGAGGGAGEGGHGGGVVSDCAGVEDLTECKVGDNEGMCIEDECVPVDCDGLEDGTECLFVTPLENAGAGFCEGGTCAATARHILTTYEGPAEGVKMGLGPVLQGVGVCETDMDNCVTSGADGKAQLMLPANQEVSYIVSTDGRIPWMAAEVPDETTISLQPGYAMWLDEDVEAFAEANTIPYPLTGGAVLLHMNPTRTEGVTFTLVDDAGALAYYADEDGFFRFDLTETTVNGFGGFFEIAPGDRQIEFGGSATNCTATLGWPGDAPNRVKVPVRVGHVTLASMDCDVQ